MRGPVVPLVVIVFALLAALAACTGEDQPRGDDDCSVESDDGRTEHEIEVGGETRSYRVYAPGDVPEATRLPVLYLFHPLNTTAEFAAAYTELPAAGEEHGFIVVAPEAGPTLSWDFLTPSSAPKSDLAFARAVMDEAVEKHCVEEERQYVAGLSNGSAMTFGIACEGDFPVAAYAGVAAIGFGEECRDAPPTSILYVHGTDDEVVPFDGGPTPVGPTAPVIDSLDSWAQHDGCGGPPETSRVGDDVERRVWRCPGATVDAYIVEGGGHTWPGAVPLDGLGPTVDTIDATELIVEFFDLT